MASLNSCNFIGNVTKDPELKYLPNGTAVADFGIAVNRNYTTKDGEKREEVTYLNLSAFARTAEIIYEYAKKGKSVYVGCRAQVDQWDDKETGKKRSAVKFIVEDVQLLGGAPKEAGNAPAKTPADPDNIPMGEGERPF